MEWFMSHLKYRDYDCRKWIVSVFYTLGFPLEACEILKMNSYYWYTISWCKFSFFVCFFFLVSRFDVSTFVFGLYRLPWGTGTKSFSDIIKPSNHRSVNHHWSIHPTREASYGPPPPDPSHARPQSEERDQSNTRRRLGIPGIRVQVYCHCYHVCCYACCCRNLLSEGNFLYSSWPCKLNFDERKKNESNSWK